MDDKIKTAPRTDPVTPRTDTYTIKGGSDVVWGVDETSALGTVTDVQVDKEALHELLYNQQGAVNGVVIFDESTAVTLTVLAKASAEMPATGSSLTAGTVTGLVMKTSEAHNYRGLKKFDVTVNTWTNLTLS